jgi:hypothetical protein
MNVSKLVAITSIIFAVSLSTFADSTNKIVAAKNYTQEQIDAFNRKAQRQFDQMGKKLDDLKAKAQKTTGDARASLDQKIAEAQQKADDVKPKLKELKTATTNAWSDIKSGFDKGLTDFKNALK